MTKLFGAIVADEVIYDLIIEGFERDNEKKTLEIKSFTIGDVGAGAVETKDYKILFQTVYQAFEKVALMQNQI